MQSMTKIYSHVAFSEIGLSNILFRFYFEQILNQRMIFHIIGLMLKIIA